MKNEDLGKHVRKTWEKMEAAEKVKVKAIGAWFALIVILSIAVTVAEFDVIHSVDETSEHVGHAIYHFLLVGLYVSLALSLTSSTTTLWNMFGLAVHVTMVYFVRTTLRPNAEVLDLSPGELDFVEYGLYASAGATLLGMAYVGVNHKTFGKFVPATDKQ